MDPKIEKYTPLLATWVDDNDKLVVIRHCEDTCNLMFKRIERISKITEEIDLTIVQADISFELESETIIRTS